VFVKQYTITLTELL